MRCAGATLLEPAMWNVALHSHIRRGQRTCTLILAQSLPQLALPPWQVTTYEFLKRLCVLPPEKKDA